MRLYSPVPIVSRVSVNDDEFNGMCVASTLQPHCRVVLTLLFFWRVGTRIPAGTSIIISAGKLRRLLMVVIRFMRSELVLDSMLVRNAGKTAESVEKPR